MASMFSIVDAIFLVMISAMVLYWLHCRKSLLDWKNALLLFKIYYATESGTAERFAHRLRDALMNSKHVNISVSDLGSFEGDTFVRGDSCLNIFILTTYGDGQPPNNAFDFYKWLCNRHEHFSNLNFVVFGLGDSSYMLFNEFAKQVDKRFGLLGASRKMPLYLGDGAKNMEADFHTWRKSLLKLYNLDDCSGTSFVEKSEELTISPPSAADIVSLGDVFTGEPERLFSYRFNAPPFTPSNPFLAPILQNSELFKCSDRSCRLVVFDFANSCIEYAAGDHLAVMPRNSPEIVQKLCDILSVNPEDYIYGGPPSIDSSKNRRGHFPTPCTLRTAFTHYLDIASMPRFDLIESLISCTKVEGERLFLRNLISVQDDENENSYENWILASRRTVVEMLEDLPSCKPSADLLCRLLPRLQPRYYSVASSSRLNPNQLRLIVKVYEYTSLAGRLHKGIASNFLAAKEPGEYVPVFLRRSDFRLPQNPVAPVIMVGAGTGVAPFLGFIQERVFIKSKGGKLGQAMLFYGCRNRDENSVISEELNNALNAGVISHLELAFSREQAEKVYVQHLMLKLAETIWDLVNNQQAGIYICGDSKNMARDVKQALLAIFQRQGSLTPLGAEDFFQQLRTNKRCLFDAWS